MSLLPPAIVLGIDTPIGLTVMRELGAHGVPVHGVGKPGAIGAASRWCASFTERPRAPLPEWLPDLIAKTGAAALFAVSETDLEALAALPEVIDGCRVLTPRPEPLALALDKMATLDLAARTGLDVPAGWRPHPDEDFVARAITLTYPVVLKWPDPTAMRPILHANGIPFLKSEFARGPAELLVLLDRYATLGRWPLVQDYCPGLGLGQMLYMENGAATLRFQHRRLHEMPPEGGVSTWCEALPLDLHQDQMRLSEALLRAMGWHGPAMVEYRFDATTGRYRLMEVNGRFWGSLPLASCCGAHFAWEGYRRGILDDRLPAATPISGRRARFMIPETRRLATILFNRKAIADPAFPIRPLRELADYMGAFFDPRTRYYVFDIRDPGPSLADLRAIMRRAHREKPR